MDVTKHFNVLLSFAVYKNTPKCFVASELESNAVTTFKRIPHTVMKLIDVPTSTPFSRYVCMYVCMYK